MSSDKSIARTIGIVFFVQGAIGYLVNFVLLAPALSAPPGLAVALQITAVTMPIFGYPILFYLIAPLGLSQLVMAVWLIAKGFDDQSPRIQED